MGRAFAFLILVWFAAAPAGAEWRRAESPNFIVYSEGSEQRLRERILLLEDFDRLLRLITGTNAPPAPTKLTLYVVRGIGELRIVRPALPASVAGFYTASTTGIAAFVDQRSEMGDNEVLFHEYAHHFMMQYSSGSYPAWYVEGFAEYFQTARVNGRILEYGNYSQARGYWLVEGSWLPMEQMLFGGQRGLGAEARARYYAQSWLLVHFFFSTEERRQRILRYLAALSRGGDARESLEPAIGVTPEALNAELRQYIARRRITYHRLARPSDAAAPNVEIRRMPASAEELLLYEAALNVGVAEGRAAALLQRVRAAAARFADDGYARRVLAHAELSLGDPAAADPLLDPLLAATPNDAGLLYLKGMRHLAAAGRLDDPTAERRNARRWLARAYRADPNHFQTLYHYAESMRGTDDFASENMSNILMLAHTLAPQVAEISVNAAMLLMERGEFAQAEALLAPLSSNVHDPGLAQAARRLVEAARTRTRPPAVQLTPAPTSDDSTPEPSS